MGRCYEYRLYYPRKQIEAVLQRMEQMSLDGLHRSNEDNSVIRLSLFFPLDEVLSDYVQGDERASNYRWKATTDKHNRVAIGTIKLWIYPESHFNQHLAEFHFGATSTSMSYLFEQSASIQKTFVSLLTAHDGVCAVLEDADYHWFETKVVWPQGYDWNRARTEFVEGYSE